LILRTAADQYKERLNNPNKKASKASRKKKSTSPEVEESTLARVKLSGTKSGNMPINKLPPSGQPLNNKISGNQSVANETSNGNQSIGDMSIEEQLGTSGG
jgi:hypothetical protein